MHCKHSSWYVLLKRRCCLVSKAWQAKENWQTRHALLVFNSEAPISSCPQHFHVEQVQNCRQHVFYLHAL